MSAVSDLKPVNGNYLRDAMRLQPSDRLHRLVARLVDTYICDLTDERIVELERVADTFRLTHADGSTFDAEQVAS